MQKKGVEFMTDQAEKYFILQCVIESTYSDVMYVGTAGAGDELSEHIVLVHKQLGLMSKVSSVCARVRARYIACARLLACASADK